jgi:phosphate ABC transporter phosphate-binding protein
MRARTIRIGLMLGAVLAMLLAETAPAGAAVSHTLINGSGSSWSSNAVNQWIADVQSSGLQVVYTASGSAVGRKDFAYKTTDFAVSDIGYQGKDPVTQDEDTSLGRAYAYLPIVAGGTAFPYQVRVGGVLKRNIRLSGKTLTRIFTNQITNWNDAAITADNNGKSLPSLPIIPVVHSEGSGSSAQFTRFMDTVYPSIWRPYLGQAGLTEYYPRKGKQIAQNGSDGVMNYISSAAANGSIGYDEYSYALAKNYPVAKILNSSGYYTLPSQYNVAVALTKAQINTNKSSPDYLLQNLNAVYTDGDVRTYPLSSYSYMIIPTASNDAKMTTAKRQTLADFLFYSVCQGQKEMGPIGYSPLPINLVQASFDQTAKLKAADPAVSITAHDVRNCNNPTFDPRNPARNYLAEIAPKPPACDHTGAGPCTGNGDAGTVNPPSSGGGGNSNGTSGGGSTPTTKAASSAKAAASAKPSTGTTVDPTTGEVVSTDTTDTSGGDIAAAPTDIAAYQRAGSGGVLAMLAALLFIIALIAPPLLARRMANRRAGGSA